MVVTCSGDSKAEGHHPAPPLHPLSALCRHPHPQPSTTATPPRKSSQLSVVYNVVTAVLLYCCLRRRRHRRRRQPRRHRLGSPPPPPQLKLISLSPVSSAHISLSATREQVSYNLLVRLSRCCRFSARASDRPTDTDGAGPMHNKIYTRNHWNLLSWCVTRVGRRRCANACII